jgi:hypothetical protein
MAYLYLTPHPNPLHEGEGAWTTRGAGTRERKGSIRANWPRRSNSAARPYNYRESYNKFGLEGLLHGYTPSESKSRETQRRLHVDPRLSPGTKARELEQHGFELRRIVIWNLSSNRRASGLCWDGERDIDLETFAQAIGQRWGPRRTPSSLPTNATPCTIIPALASARAKNRRSITPNARRSPLNSKASGAS